MNNVTVLFNTEARQWEASDGSLIAFGNSPEEATKNLADVANVTLAKPTEEDWITPDNL